VVCIELGRHCVQLGQESIIIGNMTPKTLRPASWASQIDRGLIIAGSILILVACGARSNLDNLSASVGGANSVGGVTAGGGAQSTGGLISAVGTGGLKATGGSANTGGTAAIGGSITNLAVGHSHTCALIKGGVQCWGSNWSGELGNNSIDQSPALVPVQVQGLTSGVMAITAGGAHTCALVNGGAQWWGGICQRE